MLTTFFANMDIFYLVVGVATSMLCVAVGTRESIAIAFIVMSLYLFGQFEELWEVPGGMLNIHGGIVLLIAGTVSSKIAEPLLICALGMVIADVIWILLPYCELGISPTNNFWWQSVLGLSYLVMCAVAGKGCYDTHKINRYLRRVKNGSFHACKAHADKGLV